ncbi:hypothetical protein GCM10022380_34240 [Amycolatopsis tucumanensis]|uniref:Uncharacterized protein n=1 Tax=Amycolatopsis tucumanensis TaxID=401106 RepID=A0ABP7IAB5_9PSEU
MRRRSAAAVTGAAAVGCGGYRCGGGRLRRLPVGAVRQPVQRRTGRRVAAGRCGQRVAHTGCRLATPSNAPLQATHQSKQRATPHSKPAAGRSQLANVDNVTDRAQR